MRNEKRHGERHLAISDIRRQRGFYIPATYLGTDNADETDTDTHRTLLDTTLHSSRHRRSQKFVCPDTPSVGEMCFAFRSYFGFSVRLGHSYKTDNWAIEDLIASFVALDTSHPLFRDGSDSPTPRFMSPKIISLCSLNLP